MASTIFSSSSVVFGACPRIMATKSSSSSRSSGRYRYRSMRIFTAPTTPRFSTATLRRQIRSRSDYHMHPMERIATESANLAGRTAVAFGMARMTRTNFKAPILRQRNFTSKSSPGPGPTPAPAPAPTPAPKQSQQPPPQQSSSIDSTLMVPKAFGIGTFAGLLGSLAGMGGGFVMIPLMTSASILKLSQHTAHGTSLCAVTATGLAGAWGYSGHVDYPAAAAIAASGMVTARFGALATSHLTGPALKRALGIFMLCVAPLVPAKSYIMSPSDAENDDDRKTTKKVCKEDHSSSSSSSSLWPLSPPMPMPMPMPIPATTVLDWSPQRLVIPAVIGCGSGFLAGLFGVGGGAIVVPALTLATDLDHYQALGTSLCAMSLPALVGTLTHYSKGNVALKGGLAPALALGAFVGGYWGGRLGVTVEETYLKWGFSVLMVVLGGRTLASTVGKW